MGRERDGDRRIKQSAGILRGVLPREKVPQRDRIRGPRIARLGRFGKRKGHHDWQVHCGDLVEPSELEPRAENGRVEIELLGDARRSNCLEFGVGIKEHALLAGEEGARAHRAHRTVRAVQGWWDLLRRSLLRGGAIGLLGGSAAQGQSRPCGSRGIRRPNRPLSNDAAIIEVPASGRGCGRSSSPSRSTTVPEPRRMPLSGRSCTTVKPSRRSLSRVAAATTGWALMARPGA